jgi:hypothetical protein
LQDVKRQFEIGRSRLDLSTRPAEIVTVKTIRAADEIE